MIDLDELEEQLDLNDANWPMRHIRRAVLQELIQELRLARKKIEDLEYELMILNAGEQRG